MMILTAFFESFIIGKLGSKSLEETIIEQLKTLKCMMPKAEKFLVSEDIDTLEQQKISQELRIFTSVRYLLLQKGLRLRSVNVLTNPTSEMNKPKMRIS